MGQVIPFPGAQRALPGLQPPPAPAAAIPTATAPAARICWNCANMHGTPARGEKFCTRCQLRGEDTPLVPCKVDQCNTVAKRRRPGQQFFDCGRHPATQGQTSL